MKLSNAQRQMLVNLDGKFGPIQCYGNSRRTLEILRGLGLVEYTKRTKFVKVYGYPGRTQPVYEVKLTREGSDFIYNGGIDY